MLHGRGPQSEELLSVRSAEDPRCDLLRDLLGSRSGRLRYICDDMRHLICVPYTVENLHAMARDLNIKRCWFHRGASYAHYDIPKRRIAEISARCERVTPRQLLAIIKGELARDQ